MSRKKLARELKPSAEKSEGVRGEQVKASPTKRFFVEMLTRDITLEDAILDLLDNCVDGIIRSTTIKNGDKKPYADYWAKIRFDKEHFEIADNCGGMPKDLAKNYAFMMGRSEERDADRPTIGMYGIGMKRAIFKLGQNAEVVSKTKENEFSVSITPEWMQDDTKWELELLAKNGVLSKPGVRIRVDDLRPAVSTRFDDDKVEFEDLLRRYISNNFSLIILKGFTVELNGVAVHPQPMTFLADLGAKKNSDQQVEPYIYRGQKNGVDITIVIGLYRPVPDEQDEDEELRGRHSRDQAGITIICNDRVVLYCDKSRATGWGEATVPNYHNQFIAIAGVAIFKSDDASLLPITTTKRGIDGGSDTYLFAKDFIREGLKHFTDFTYKWKGDAHYIKDLLKKTESHSIENVLAAVPSEKMRAERKGSGQKSLPKLPLPKESAQSSVFIRYRKPLKDIRKVASYLYEEADIPPSEVGEQAFDHVLAEAKKKK